MLCCDDSLRIVVKKIEDALKTAFDQSEVEQMSDKALNVIPAPAFGGYIISECTIFQLESFFFRYHNKQQINSSFMLS